jgi:hypothetical protein
MLTLHFVKVTHGYVKKAEPITLALPLLVLRLLLPYGPGGQEPT